MRSRSRRQLVRRGRSMLRQTRRRTTYVICMYVYIYIYVMLDLV